MRELLDKVNEMESIELGGVTLPKGRWQTHVLVYGRDRVPVVVKAIGRSKIYKVVQTEGGIVFELLPKAGTLYSVSHVRGYNEDSTMSYVTRKLVLIDLYEKLYKEAV